MTDLRKAAEMAAKVLANALSIDFNDKRDWYSYKHDVEYATNLLVQALAQPEQKLNDPPAYVEPPTSDYHNGWEEGFEAAKNLFKKESAPQNADPRLLLVRKDNCIALAQPEQEQEQEPEIVRRVRRYAGKRRESVSSPHINAKECIALANWIESMLAQPEQESISTNEHLCAMLRQVHDVLACTALPMKRPWQGLTDEEIKDILDCERGGLVDIKKAEQILKEKNGG